MSKLPKTAADIRKFINSNYEGRYYHNIENPSDGDKFLVATHDLLSSFSEWADSNEPELNGWISVEERLPDVEQGRSEMFTVSVLSTAYKKQYVSAAHYLNKFELCPEDESFDTDGYGIEIVSGWFYHSIETENYSKVHESDLYKITHWMPLPPPPVVSAEMAQTTGD